MILGSRNVCIGVAVEIDPSRGHLPRGIGIETGKVELDEITLCLPDASIEPTTVKAAVSGEVIPCVISHEDQTVHVRLTRTAEVLQNDTLTVTLGW